MRVVVAGASGNVGTSVLRELADEPAVESVLGLCRRVPELQFPKVEWSAADVTATALAPLFRGADAVVHLAWLIQPGRDRNLTQRVNVFGSERVFRAVTEAAVPALVYASSVGAYAPGPKDRRVDESWPTTGVDSSFYSRDKVAVERLLDRFERDAPSVRRGPDAAGADLLARGGIRDPAAVRGSPAARHAAEAGADPGRAPKMERLVFQALHSHDVARAYRLAVVGDAAGPFNLAAEPVIDSARLGGATRRPGRAGVREGAACGRGRELSPAPPAVRAGLAGHGAGRAADGHRAGPRSARLESAGAARWTRSPICSSGMREGAGLDTPPLEPGGAGPLRLRELLSGVGARLG